MGVSNDLVDLRECKAAASRLYPRGHHVRETIAAEPDFLSLVEAQAKIPVLLRMVLASQPVEA